MTTAMNPNEYRYEGMVGWEYGLKDVQIETLLVLLSNVDWNIWLWTTETE